MKPIDFLWAALLLLILSLQPGCSPLQQAQQALQAGQMLTPEQIAAYDQAGVAIYICFQVGGPPPNGVGTLITAPKSVNSPPPAWNSDCHPLPPK